jgi:hypothetical protein
LFRVKRVTICATNFTYHNLTPGLQAWALPQRKDNHARSEIWATLSVAHKQRPSHMERPANKKETTTLTLPKHKQASAIGNPAVANGPEPP